MLASHPVVPRRDSELTPSWRVSVAEYAVEADPRNWPLPGRAISTTLLARLFLLAGTGKVISVYACGRVRITKCRVRRTPRRRRL